MVELASIAATGEPFVGLDRVDVRAIAAFDAALVVEAPNVALLEGTPARSLSVAIAGLVRSLQKLDVDRVNRRFTWLERFTGADLEARIAFDIASRHLSIEMAEVAASASRARAVLASLHADQPRLAAATNAYGSLLFATLSFLDAHSGEVSDIDRLRRRAANLQALHASSRMTETQISLAIDGLTGLLDRYADVEQLLLPVWQHHALTIAQSPANVNSSEALPAIAAPARRRLSFSRARPSTEMPT
jgi:hypothetical protein